MNTPRKQDETIEEYHQRLKDGAAATNTKLKGTIFWNSTEQGTYKKPK